MGNIGRADFTEFYIWCFQNMEIDRFPIYLVSPFQGPGLIII